MNLQSKFGICIQTENIAVYTSMKAGRITDKQTDGQVTS